MTRDAIILLNGVTASGAGSAFVVSRGRYFTIYYEATSVTSGATVVIEVKTPTGNWVVLDTKTISSDGTTIVEKNAKYSEMRANITSYTDGTFSVSADIG